MRDSVPSPRYSPVCNVLRQWNTSLIPTYRVYRLYDTKNVLVMIQYNEKLIIATFFIVITNSSVL